MESLLARGVACTENLCDESMPAIDDVPPCPGCGGVLDLTQPIADRPDLLLGVCAGAGCTQWSALGGWTGRWRIQARVFWPVEVP